MTTGVGDASVLLVPLSVGVGQIEEDAKSVVQAVKPQWSRDEMKVKVFTDGITNSLVGVHVGQMVDMILVRVYGESTELLINREDEKRNMQALHQAGCCPPLYAEFENGIAYGFAMGKCTTAETVRDDKVWRLIADKMAQMHCIEIDVPKQPCLFNKLRRYVDLAPGPNELCDKVQNDRLIKETPSKEDLRHEVELLESELSGLESPVVFCHNDLLLNNIVHNQEDDIVTFIDYEYGDYNYQAYDLGNHFAEYAGVDELDFARYPGKSYQLEWLRYYLECWHRHRGSNKLVTDREVQSLYVQTNKFALVAHLFWGIWALIQQRHSKIDFDFLSYGILKLTEYKRRKEEFLALTAPSD